MGCGLSQVHLAQLESHLDKVGIEAFDKVYDVGSAQIRGLNLLMSQLMMPLEEFQRASGINPEQSIGFGLVSMLVAASAESDGDLISADLRLMETLPGLALDAASLNSEVATCYAAWTSLVKSLETTLVALEGSHTVIIKAMEQVKQVPDLMLLMAYQEQWKVAKYSELSPIAEANATKLDFAIETLGSLIQRVREVSYQLAFTVEQLSIPENMALINLFGHEARDRSVLDPAVVQDIFKAQFAERVEKLNKT